MRVPLARNAVVGNVGAEYDGLVGEEVKFLQDGENRVSFLARERTDALSLL